jgi:hypothetical protein
MAKLVNIHCYGLPLSTRIYPGVGGRGDTGMIEAITGHPALNIQKVTVQSNGNMASATTAPPFGRRNQLYFEDFATGVQNTLVYKWGTPPAGASSPLTTYSARLYYRITSLGDAFVANVPPTICRFASTGTGRFDVALSAYDVNEAFGTVNPLRPYIPGITSPSTTGFDIFKTYRLEIQVDSTRTPSVVVRIYELDTTSVIWEHRGSPASVSANQLILGDNSSGYVNPFYVGDVEVWDTYNADGQFTSNPSSPTAATVGATGVPYTAPTYKWYEWNGSTLTQLTPKGTWNGSGYDAMPPFSEVANRQIANVTYSSATYRYRTTPATDLTLYTPSGSAPAGGWPCVVYAHSGFFTTGTRTSDLTAPFLQHLCNAGFAVASIDYTVGTAAVGMPLQPGTYPTWPAAGSGQYPSWIIDYKAALRYLQTTGGLGINGNKLIATGYSAGGYLAIAANVSRDLTNDGSGRNLTLNNATYGIGSGLSDPTVLASVTWGAPVSMQTAYDYDPTDPANQPSGTGYGVGNQGVGTLRVAAAAFRGLAYNVVPNLTNTDLPAMIAANAAKCAPIWYSRGTADYLVHWAHEPLLSAVCSTNSVPYTLHTDPTFHDNLMVEFDWHPTLAYLRSLV